MQAERLDLSVCFEVEFLLLMEQELAGDDTTTSVGDLRFDPPIRPPGPRCVELLSGLALPWRSGSVRPPDATTTP